MTDSIKCAACGASLLPGAVECGACKTAIVTPVSVKSGGVLARIAAGIVDLLLICALVAAFSAIGVGLWLVLVAWGITLEIGYRLHGSLGKSLFGLSVQVGGRGRFYLRETVGKLASLAMFGIGFLLIFGAEGLALHDLIAGSRVVRAKRVYPALHAIRVLALLIAVGVVAFVGAKLGSPKKTTEVQSPAQSSSLDSITRQIPAVLTIYCYNERDRIVAQGSGFLISANGLGITNFHVLDTAHRAEAQLGDGRRYHVLAVHAFDADKDVVVFQLGRMIEGTVEWPENLPFLTMGSSKNVVVGDRIATVGSPEGLANSVTDGLVSAIRRDQDVNLLQITAPISPGSSGGPVFDLHGNVIAITVAQLSEGQNLNFAIPIETAQEVERQEHRLGFDEFRSVASLLGGHSHSGNARQDVTSSSAVDHPRIPKVSFVAGSYSGTVHNQTADQSAEFVIVARSDAGNVQGCMEVVKPLIGSGPLHGQVKGSTITFTVNAKAFDLFFRGNIANDKITGTYAVSAISGVVQEGDFYLKRVDSKVPPSDSVQHCPTDAEMNDN